MVKLNLTFVQRTPGTSAAGKPYVRMSIQAKEYGLRYLSGFSNQSNDHWVPGMEVEVHQVKEVVKGDKTYLNFEMVPSKNSAIEEKLDRILRIVESMTGARNKTPEVKPKEYPEYQGQPDFDKDF